MSWIDNIDKFKVSKEFDDYFGKIKDNYETGLNKTSLFLLSTAVGIVQEGRKPIKKPGESVNFYSIKGIDKFDLKGKTGRVLDVIITHQMRGTDVKEKKKAVEKYANYGIELIYKHIEKTGSISESILISNAI